MRNAIFSPLFHQFHTVAATLGRRSTAFDEANLKRLMCAVLPAPRSAQSTQRLQSSAKEAPFSPTRQRPLACTLLPRTYLSRRGRQSMKARRAATSLVRKCWKGEYTLSPCRDLEAGRFLYRFQQKCIGDCTVQCEDGLKSDGTRRCSDNLYHGMPLCPY